MVTRRPPVEPAGGALSVHGPDADRVTAGQIPVEGGIGLHPLFRSAGDRPGHPRRNPHGEHVIGDDHSRRYRTARRDQRAAADDHAVEHGGSVAHQCFFPDDRAADHTQVTDGRPLPHLGHRIAAAVQDRPILDVRAPPHQDRPEIGTQHGSVPNRRLGLHTHVPDQDGGGRDTRGGADLGSAPLELEQQHPPMMHRAGRDASGRVRAWPRAGRRRQQLRAEAEQDKAGSSNYEPRPSRTRRGAATTSRGRAGQGGEQQLRAEAEQDKAGSSNYEPRPSRTRRGAATTSRGRAGQGGEQQLRAEAEQDKAGSSNYEPRPSRTRRGAATTSRGRAGQGGEQQLRAEAEQDKAGSSNYEPRPSRTRRGAATTSRGRAGQGGEQQLRAEAEQDKAGSSNYEPRP